MCVGVLGLSFGRISLDKRLLLLRPHGRGPVMSQGPRLRLHGKRIRHEPRNAPFCMFGMLMTWVCQVPTLPKQNPGLAWREPDDLQCPVS